VIDNWQMIIKRYMRIICCLIISLSVLQSAAVSQTRRPAPPPPPASRISYLTLEEARPVLDAFKDELPPELAGINTRSDVKRWSEWVRNSDLQIRARLEQGDEDSIVNLLLFGTSFTTQPRLTESQLQRLSRTGSRDNIQIYSEILRLRLDDFSQSLSRSGNNERLQFARTYLSRKLGVSLATEEGITAAKQFLIRAVARVFGETTSFLKLIEQARENQQDDFAVRSQLYRQRGLSSDTSLKPNFAIEKALKEIVEKGHLKNVRRVAIIGPGLDFTDKDEGYDFYPPQTLQPFAIIDTLLKYGLTATPAALSVDTYDLSPKVNLHLAGLRARGLRRETYTIHLPLSDDRKWTNGFLQYWETFGSRLAAPRGQKPGPAANVPDVKTRVVNIRSEFLSKIRAFDTNVVLQSPNLLVNDRYDLIIGTNIFLYYDSFNQALAMRNLEKMLKPGGILLSNNALVEFPFTAIRAIGYTSAEYSDRQADADAIVWYRRQ